MMRHFLSGTHATILLHVTAVYNVLTSTSRNCTKHQVRCDYMDSPTAMMPDSPQSPQQPNLLWTPEIEATIELWRQTGEFPFPELRVYPQPQWRVLTTVDLRLIHHLSSISSEMFRNRTSKSTLWTDMMPKYGPIFPPAAFVQLTSGQIFEHCCIPFIRYAQHSCLFRLSFGLDISVD